MTLGAIVADAATQQKQLVVYAPTETDLADRLAARNVTVDSRAPPATGVEPFIVVRDDSGFLGALSLDDLLAFLEPSRGELDELGALGSGYRAVSELLDDTVFTALDRRQLLATSREIEDRAWRTGTGTLRVGFQSSAAFQQQWPLYRRLAADTDLDVHVYTVDQPMVEDVPASLTFHVEPTPDVGRYWFLLFDGGDDDRACALVAEQRTDDSYRGVWTYDASLVNRAFDLLAGSSP